MPIPGSERQEIEDKIARGEIDLKLYDAASQAMRVMLKSLRLTGSVLRSQPNALKEELAGELRAAVWPLLEEGRVAPVLREGGVFRGLERAGEAHRLMESSEHVGKIVLVV